MHFSLLFLTFFLLSVSAFPKSSHKRIINGRDAKIKEYPYQVSIESIGNQICGGSILAKRIVLTAGHCFFTPGEPSDFQVRVGSSEAMKGGKVHNVAAVRMHPKFSKFPITNDVALLLLETPIRFDSNAQPIRLADKTPKEGEVITVTGYGWTQMSAQQANHKLRVVNIPVVSKVACVKKLKPLGGYVAPGMICAGNRKGHKDACQGDSGGPAVSNKRLVGITSWGFGCGIEGRPGVYTDVASFKPFIVQTKKELLSMPKP